MTGPRTLPKDVEGPVILWMRTDGNSYSPTSFPTVQAALEAERYTSDWVITRRADYSVFDKTKGGFP